MKICKLKNLLLIITCQLLAYLPQANATIVQFETNLGDFQVNLFDTETSLTVANFLTYVNAGDYESSIIHRADSGFIIQGGGYTYNSAFPPDEIAENAPVNNEAVFSNVRGTIAMAKISGDPNSATTQWFFNLADNSANLDLQNDGFTVFGQVIDDGMLVVNAIAALQTFDLGSPFSELPLQSDPGSSDPDNTHLVIINNITVIDAATDTANSLNPTRNTLINATPTPTPTPTSDDSGGGNIGIFTLLLILLISLCKAYNNKLIRLKKLRKSI